MPFERTVRRTSVTSVPMSNEVPTYGKKRVYAQVLFWIDPRILHGLDTIALRKGVNRKAAR